MVKYKVKKKYSVIYICIMIAALVLVVFRWLNQIDAGIILLPIPIFIHVTNFALSLMLLLIFGFSVLICGGSFKVVLIGAVLLAAMNIVAKTVFTVINTPDIIDAAAGLAGVASAAIYLFILKKYGLTAQKEENK